MISQFWFHWAQVDLASMTLRVEETKTGEPLELPLTRQLAAILERRFAERERLPEHSRVWVFPSETSRSGRINSSMQHLNARIGEAGGGEVLVPCPSQLLHHRGRPRTDAAQQSDQAAGQRCKAPVRDRGLRGGLDHGTAARERAAHRRPNRRTDRRVSLSAGAGVLFDMLMSTQTRKHTARIKRTIPTRQTVDALQPAEKPYIAWDDRLVGFGVRVLPSGTKSFILNYCPGGRAQGPQPAHRPRSLRKDHPKQGQATWPRRCSCASPPARTPPQSARRRAAMPTLREAFEEFLAAGPGRKAGTVAVYRRNFYRHLGSLPERPLDTITARDVEQCFSRLTAEAGWVPANNAVRMLRSLYLRRCVDVEGLHNPVDQWRATGGRSHRQRSRRIPPPA